MNRNLIIKSLAVISIFLLGAYGRRTIESFVEIEIESIVLLYIYHYSWWILLPFLGTGLLFGFRGVFDQLGIWKGFIRGLIFSVVAVLPMFFGSAVLGTLNPEYGIAEALSKSILPGFTEELLFRGFLFGLLFLRLGWGFIPASALGAIFFGIGHLYQGSTPVDTLGVFIITALGAGWFAWLYVEWNRNLWVPIFMHTLMNLSWGLFDVSENALGSLLPNIFRAATITASIIITLRYHRKKRGLAVKRTNLICNNTSFG